MTSKKIILVLSASIFIILFAIFEYCIFFKQTNPNHKIPITCECPQIKNSDTKPTEGNLDSEAVKEWNTYYDERYKYRIDFPAGSNMANIYEHKIKHSKNEFTITNGGVAFSLGDLPGPGIISVEVFENSEFHSPDEWLKNRNTSEDARIIVEKRINIDRNEAIVTYPVSIVDGKIWEEFKRDKTTVLIKDNNLFIITTGMENCESEKVLNSFKFITGDYPIY